MLGVLLLHPATMAVYWFEFHGELSETSRSGWVFVASRTIASCRRDPRARRARSALIRSVAVERGVNALPRRDREDRDKRKRSCH